MAGYIATSNKEYEEIQFSTADTLFLRERLRYGARFKKILECVSSVPLPFTEMVIPTADYSVEIDASVLFKEWVPAQDAVELWEKLSSELKVILDGSDEIPADVTLFDGDSVESEEDQRVEVKCHIKNALKQFNAREAVAALKAARQKWPNTDEFGKGDDFSSLKEIFLADYYPREVDKDTQVDVLSPEFQEALKKLNDCFKEENMKSLFQIQAKKRTENDILAGIGVHIIQKLAGSAETSIAKSKNECPCGCQDHVTGRKKMFIGTTETWHGELDLFAFGGVGMTVTQDVELEEDTAEDDGQDDDDNTIAEPTADTSSVADAMTLRPKLQNPTSNGIEFKTFLSAKQKEMEQIIGQSIVFGFTEYNRHPDQTPYIPSILIDSKKFWALIYDPVADCLLAGADDMPFIHTNVFLYHKFDRFQGLFLLWILLNYRLFFKKVVKNDTFVPYVSSFKEAAMKIEKLSNYQALHEFQARVSIEPKYDPRRIGFCLDQPKSKKRKVV